MEICGSFGIFPGPKKTLTPPTNTPPTLLVWVARDVTSCTCIMGADLGGVGRIP